MPLPYRAAQPFQAGAEVSELTLGTPELTGLKQGVDPPQPAPHLDPGAAEGIGGLEHPPRQHDPLGEALGGAAGQLAGPERVDERDGFVRCVSARQRLPAHLSAAVILAPVHQRLRVTGRHPGAQVVRNVVPGQRARASSRKNVTRASSRSRPTIISALSPSTAPPHAGATAPAPARRIKCWQ